MTPVEYDEEKSFEEMTFDELGDALSCPYNYALCIDSLVFESNGAFGEDTLVAVVGKPRLSYPCLHHVCFGLPTVMPF